MEVQRFEHIPSPEEFESLIESKNVPAVFCECVKDWKALSLWDPFNGGLDYLQERVGTAIVEAMLSQWAPVFYGNLGNHERIPLPFSTYINYCKKLLQIREALTHGHVLEEGHRVSEISSEDTLFQFADVRQLYLAQIPIMNDENKDRYPLDVLLEDFHQPSLIERKAVSSINLWMNGAPSRSSTHYDPHHNLLCVIAGSKQVVLWAPSAVPVLYPRAIYGEASNHSAVNIENLDYSLHGRAKQSMEHSQTAILHAGDVLFVPEGWFHQVNSDELTIAVNLWWQSDMILSMPEHMDAYYLRRIMRRLIDKEMNKMLEQAAVAMDTSLVDDRESVTLTGLLKQDFEDTNSSENPGWDGLSEMILEDPCACTALYHLVSLVHEAMQFAGEHVSAASEVSNDKVKGENIRLRSVDSSDIKNDSIACIFLTLKPAVLENVLLLMVHKFPRTLEALVLYELSPVAAEVLTRKFDEMDKQRSKERANWFYKQFYSAFDDQFAAMEAILNRKESFGKQAFKTVLDQYLGLKCTCIL